MNIVNRGAGRVKQRRRASRTGNRERLLVSAFTRQEHLVPSVREGGLAQVCGGVGASELRCLHEPLLPVGNSLRRDAFALGKLRGAHTGLGELLQRGPSLLLSPVLPPPTPVRSPRLVLHRATSVTARSWSQSAPEERRSRMDYLTESRPILRALSADTPPPARRVCRP